MKPCVEIEGKTIDNAIEKACKELKIKKDCLKYDIISSGSSGIFGLVGVKKAKIRVRLPDNVASDNKMTGFSSLEKTVKLDTKGVKSLVDEAFSKPVSKKAKEKTQNLDKEKEKHKEKEKQSSESSPAPPLPEAPIQAGQEALQKMISLITTEAEVTVQIHNEFVLYNISGGNSAVLIGKRGQTLEAMQYLVDKIVNKQSDQRIRIQIDVEGYMKSRRDNLKNLATRLAEKTKRTGKPSTISQMTAHDRRIVHLQLKDDKEVRTQSVGDGYYRRLIIFPKKGSARKKKQRTKAASASNNRQTSKEVKK